MTSKKHYIKVAQIIKGEREVWEDKELRVKIAIDNIENMLSNMFLQDNPKFNKDVFHKACNI